MKFPQASFFAGLCGCLASISQAQETLPAVVATIPVITAETAAEPLPAIEILPSDFLDCVSQQSKARWRQLYREPAASAPPTERLRVAFTLGGLLADSHLALQAGDAQQVKNINQDVLKYCSSLGLADKVSPMLMSGSKMAEGQDWIALRPKLTETYELVEKLLYEQRDEDPAELVHLGMWMRLFEITATVIQADTEMPNKTLCVGSVPLLGALVGRYEKLSQTTRENPDIAVIGNTLQLLQKHWSGSNGRPNQELIDFTLEKVQFVNGKLTLK